MGERRWIDLAQASLGGQGRKAGPVLDAIKSLLFYRDRELAIREEGGRSVAVEGVETEYVHWDFRHSVRSQILLGKWPGADSEAGNPSWLACGR